MESRAVLVGAPAAAAAVVSKQTQKLSLFMLTAMVVGSMVGPGIFSLPHLQRRDGAVRCHYRVVHRGERHVHAGRVAVIGGHTRVGVPIGTGSSGVKEIHRHYHA